MTRLYIVIESIIAETKSLLGKILATFPSLVKCSFKSRTPWHVFVSIYFWKRVQPSLTYLIQSNISIHIYPKWPIFILTPFSTLILHKSLVFTPVAPFAQSFPQKPQFYPKDLISTSSPLIFCISPVFTLTVQISLKCFFRTLIFPKSPIFPPKCPNFLKVLLGHWLPQKPCFTPSRPFCTLIFLKAPILPKSPIFTQKT